MAYQTGINSAIRSLAQTYAKRLQSAHISYERLIVFGSQVKGKATQSSDIDICVVSKAFGKDRQAERVKLLSARDDSTLDIEPHPYNPIDLENPWDSLAHEIQKYGVTI